MTRDYDDNLEGDFDERDEFEEVNVQDMVDRIRQRQASDYEPVVESDDEPEEKPAKRARRKSNIDRGKLFISMIGLLVIASIVLGSIYMLGHFRNYNAIKVLSTSETSFETNAEYLEFGDNLLKYTPDGVSYIDSSGNVVWSSGVDVGVPIAVVRGDYAAVADKGGNTVAVFDLNGLISTVTTPYNVIDIDLCKSGAFTVILESALTNYINMYDKDGNIIYEMQTSIDKSGYPLDISISEDGEKLFTSYFKLDGINITNSVTAYNFGEVGQNENADRMVGGYELDDEMVPRVQFITNDIVAAFSDKAIHLYTMKEKPSERATIDLPGEITSIFYSETYVGFVISSEAIKNGWDDDGSAVVDEDDTEDTTEETSDSSDTTVNASNADYVLYLYDLSGKQSFTYPFSIELDGIYTSDDEIIVTGGNRCIIVDTSGKTRFAYAFDDPVRSMVPSSGRNEYVVTFDTRTDIVKLKKED